MTADGPVDPIDALSRQEKNRIYYRRVVDLAVARGLLNPDPNGEIGHFAFSRFYYEGKELDQSLAAALRTFRIDHPDRALERLSALDREFPDVAEELRRESPQDKIHDLIIVGASHDVWPTGTSFTLTYPWDLAGRGRPVRFRDDLTPFMRRRIVKVLKKAGKLRTPNLFA